MRRNVILSWALVLASMAFVAALSGASTTLPELFREAKSQVKLGSYEAALSTLQKIDTASRQPGLEKDREALDGAAESTRLANDLA